MTAVIDVPLIEAPPIEAPPWATALRHPRSVMRETRSLNRHGLDLAVHSLRHRAAKDDGPGHGV